MDRKHRIATDQRQTTSHVICAGQAFNSATCAPELIYNESAQGPAANQEKLKDPDTRERLVTAHMGASGSPHRLLRGYAVSFSLLLAD